LSLSLSRWSWWCYCAVVVVVTVVVVVVGGGCASVVVVVMRQHGGGSTVTKMEVHADITRKVTSPVINVLIVMLINIVHFLCIYL
jgi:hypothetical protein